MYNFQTNLKTTRFDENEQPDSFSHQCFSACKMNRFTDELDGSSQIHEFKLDECRPSFLLQCNTSEPERHMHSKIITYRVEITQ